MREETIVGEYHESGPSGHVEIDLFPPRAAEEKINHGGQHVLNLGRYEVIRELGKGAMGIVYLAKDPLIGRLVALKTIRLGASTDDDEAKEFQQRFIREAQAAGILNHPAIVTVHDIGESDESNVSFIAMEYVEGDNLKELLARGRRMSYPEIAEIVAQVADALDYAHQKGIVHRDVKPANIILCGDARAKITDFGIAKIATSVANLTTTGQFLGTPNYMAPEQIKGTAVDGRSDLFSLGVVLYEALTRRKPFGADSLTSISYKIVHEAHAPLGELDPSIPEGFDAIIERSLAKNPADRFQRGRDLAAQLRAVRFDRHRTQSPEMLLAETTMLIRDDDPKLPTMEVPFPEAVVESTADRLESEAAYPDDPLNQTPVARGRRTERLQRRVTLAGVRVRGTLRRPISRLLFFSVAGVLIATLGIAVLALDRGKVEVPEVDVKREGLVSRQRQLRVEGRRHLERGNVNGAFTSYQQLLELAPDSPAITEVLRRLELIRLQRLSVQQRRAHAEQKLLEGRQLYEQKKYEDAIPVFEEAFSLNPSSDEAVNFLKMSREQLSSQQAKKAGATRVGTRARESASDTRGSSGDRPSPVVSAVASAPVTLVTTFASPVADGYILIKSGEQTVLHENIWEEKKGFLRRRSPRTLNATREFRPASTELHVWIIIPSLRVQEHRVLIRNFRPDVVHRLTIKFDPSSKAFEFLWS